MKKIFVRSLASVLAIAVMLCFASCAPGVANTPEATESVGRTDGPDPSGTDYIGFDNIITDDMEDSVEGYILKSAGLTVEISKTGAITSVSGSGTEYVKYSGNGSFFVKLDPVQGNIWKTDPDSSLNVVRTDADVSTRFTALSRNSVTLASVLNGEFELVRRYVLDNQRLTVTSEIRNVSGNGTVIAVTPVILMGIRSGGRRPLNCAWPYHEGQVYYNGNIGIEAVNGTKSVSAHYPTPLSMQYVSLFDDSRSVYFGVHDPKAEYKNFTYSVDWDDTSGVVCEFLPFASAGERKVLAPVVMNFGTGDWTAGADIYREFLLEAGWIKDRTPYSSSFTGAHGWASNVYFNDYRTKYVKEAPAKIASTFKNSAEKVIERSGLEWIWITGWHDGGFDTLYPDYELSEELGGANGFVRGLKEVHDAGAHALLYVNAHIADTISKFYALHGEECAIRKPDGGTYTETYPESGTKSTFTAMCPCASEYKTRLLESVEMLRSSGADGIYFDQISEMQSYLCFDESHGHKTPATAYYEGYADFLESAAKIMDKYGPDWLFAIKGVADCFGKWIDVFFSYADFSLSEMVSYTLDAGIIGRDRYNFVSDNDENRYFNSFIMSRPFVCHREYSTSYLLYGNPNMKRFISLYKSFPDIYLTGKYVYHEGISGIIPSGVTYGVTAGDNRAAISLYNAKAMGSVSGSFVFNPPNGTVLSAYNAETGENMLGFDGNIGFRLAKGELISIIIEYGG